MFHCALKSGAIMSSNGEVHGAKLQRENTVLTAACLNEGSKTSISRSHEMKGKIVDVHPVALPLQKKWKAINTKDSVEEREQEKERETDRQRDLKKRNEERMIQVKRFKGQEQQQ